MARLFSVSAQGLQANPHLVTMVVGVKAALLVAGLPLLAGMALAYQNGAVVQGGIPKGDGMCVDEHGEATPCCAWQTDGWEGPYVGFALLGGLWTTKLAFEIRIFAISGSIAQVR